MSAKCSKLGKRYKKLLLFGYVRENSDYFVPMVINKLCLNYFDEVFYICFRGNKLKQFFKAKTGQSIMSTFKYNNDISFLCTIYPNGGYDEERQCTLYLQAIFDSTKVLNVMYDFKCNQTNTRFEGPGYGQDTVRWRVENIQLSQSHNIKELLFRIYINIHWIKYKHHIHCNKSFKINRKMSFEWIIDENLKTKLKKYKFGQYCYRIFNDMLMVRCYPKGFREYIGFEGTKKSIFVLKLLKWPYEINQMRCDYRLVIMNDGKQYKEEFFQYIRSPNDLVSQKIENVDDFFAISDGLRFNIDIKITKLWDDDRNVIGIPKNGIIESKMIK